MLGIYIHIPFCIKKCSYCDFVSVEGTVLADAYLLALEKEMELSAKLYKDDVDSVFIGGGTPGIWEAAQITKLMNALKAHFPITKDAEITIETNPGTVTPEKLAAYKACGINRISMGLQAMQPHLLELLGRQHTLQQFDVAYDMAIAAGFDNMNIDIIYAIPTQTMEDWQETLYHVLYKKPKHISAYALSIEPSTPLGRMLETGKIQQVDEDVDSDMYEAAQKLLSEKGYVNYEVSNFARGGYECRHNLKYWNMEHYLGLGVAAHSCVQRLRFANTAHLQKYIELMQRGTLQYASSQFIDEKSFRFEYIMLKLRLKQGIDFAEYKSLFQENFEKIYADALEKAQKYGLAKVERGKLMPTAKGFALQNQLAGLFVLSINNS